MSSISSKCIGSGRVLAYLRNDLAKATRSILIIGPWLDDYFAQEIIRVAPENIEARVLVRGEKNVEPRAWIGTQQAMFTFRNHWKVFQARQLGLIHAKVICIDGQITYLGSANWYRFSLEKAKEIVLRLPINEMENLEEELENLWECGTDLNLSIKTSETNIPRAGLTSAKPAIMGPEMSQEIHDPLDALALKTLRENPTAWVKGKKPQKKTSNWRPASSKDRKRLD
jgi:phosphatidylserine/phosphatidylglycerophosphate/cardiolipin synthase-like enzyme